MATQIRDSGSGRAGNRATDGGEVELLMRGAIEVDIDRARSLLASSAAVLGGLIRGIEKPDARPPKLEWTSAEVAVHLVQTFRYDRTNVEGTSTPYPVVDHKVLSSGAKESAQRIAEERERDAEKLNRPVRRGGSRFPRVHGRTRPAAACGLRRGLRDDACEPRGDIAG